MSAAAPKEKPQPLTRADFKVFRDIPTRWMDVDIYGHVNNVQYLSFFDTAVNAWYVEQGLLNPGTSSEIFLVVETGCQYFAELFFPEVVSAGIRIEKIGSSSVIFTICLFNESREQAAAQGRFVHVLVNRETRRPVPIGEDMRSALSTLAV